MSIPLLVALLFLAGVALTALAGILPAAIPGVYLGASLIAYIAYALDKSAARNGEWRIPEKTLHLLGVAGGWPGALLARDVLRHKTRKQPFRFVFWLTVLSNCAALGYLLSPAGAWLRSVA